MRLRSTTERIGSERRKVGLIQNICTGAKRRSVLNREKRRCSLEAVMGEVDSPVLGNEGEKEEGGTCFNLKAEKISNENFARFGQVCGPSEDGAVFGQEDAQLDLSQGRPRFYIMRLRRSAHTGIDNDEGNVEGNDVITFRKITHHARVTQCLGGLGPSSWYMAVAEPGCAPNEKTMKDGV